MSPLPQEMIDRWASRPDPRPDLGVVYWHMLLGHNSTVDAMATYARRRLALGGFSGLHWTPTRWLHITLLVAGTTDEIDDNATRDMLTHAAESLSDVPPARVELGRVIYHPEAIMLAVTPQHVLRPMLDAVQSATRAVTGKEGYVNGGSSTGWTPHITVCYSVARQPAEPIISILGKSLGTCDTAIDSLSLVVQRGPERNWDWHPIGTISLSDAS